MVEENKKKQRRWYVYLICLIVVLILLFFMTPTLVSSSFGKKILTKELSHLLKGELTIESLKLGWFSSQRLQGILYKSFDHKNTVSIEKVYIEDSLWSLCLRHHLNGSTEVVSPVITLELSSHPQKSHGLPYLIGLGDHLSIRSGDFSFLTLAKEHLQFKQFNLDLNLKDFSFSTEGKSIFNDTEGNFEIKTSFAAPYSFKSVIHALNFPLPLFDAFFPLLSTAIGPLLNAELSLSTDQNHLNASIELLSANVKASIHADTKNNSLSLLQPASLAFTLSPMTLEKCKSAFGIKHPFCMNRQASFQIACNSLNIPYEAASLSFKNLSYNATLSFSPITLTFCDKKDPLSVNAFTLLSSSANLATSIDVALKSSFNYQLKNPSYISTSFKILGYDQLSNVNLDILKFPVSFLDAYLGENPTFTRLLGDTLNVKLSSNNLQSKAEYLAHIDSPRLEIPELLFSYDTHFSLKKGAAFTYLPPDGFMMEDIKIDKLYGTLETFHLSLANLEELQLLLKIQNEKMQFKSPYFSDLLTFNNTAISIETDHLNHLNIEATTKALSAERALLKNPLQTKILAALHLKQFKVIEIPSLECFAENDKIKFSLLASIQDQLTTCALLKPLTLEIHPSLDMLSSWIGSSSILVFPFPIKLTLQSKPLFFNQPLFSQLVCEGDLELEKFDLIDKTHFREFSFLDVKTHFTADAKKKTFTSTTDSKILSKGEAPGNLSCSLVSNEFHSFQFLENALEASFSYKKIPSSLLDTLFGYQHALKILIGNSFEGKFHVDRKETASLIDTTFSSPNIVCVGDVAISNHTLELGKAFQSDIKLTQEAYGAFEELFGEQSQTPSFVLTQESLVRCKLKTLHWPLKPLRKTAPLSLKEAVAHLTEHLNHSFFNVTTTTERIMIQSHLSGELTSLEDVELECIKNSQQSPVLFHLTSHITDETEHRSKQKGSVNATMNLQSVYDKQNRPMLLSKLNATLDHFPTMLVDSFFQVIGLKGLPPSVLLGKELNATLVTDLENLSGSIDIEVNSTDSKGNLNAFLTDGVVKLSKPIQASLNITPKLADFFLSDMDFNLALAKNPLKLFISEKGFYLPLDPVDLKKLQIREATANLGQIICNNQGNPYEISGFFKLNLDNRSQVSLWFAPMNFSVNNGYFFMDRMEVLFNNAYQIAFWGNVNLLKKRVDMILGLTAQSLKKAFGIRGLPNSFVLQIPMQGPIGNVKVNKEVATTRIAFLLARSSGLTSQGGLWGGIVDALGDMANDQVSVPPAKPPFPWGDAISQHEEREKNNKTVNIIK